MKKIVLVMLFMGITSSSYALDIMSMAIGAAMSDDGSDEIHELQTEVNSLLHQMGKPAKYTFERGHHCELHPYIPPPPPTFEEQYPRLRNGESDEAYAARLQRIRDLQKADEDWKTGTKRSFGK